MMRARLGRALVTAALILVATMLLAVYVGDGRLVLFGNLLAFVALVVSLDLMVGQAGMLALGHAAFFGVGAYVSSIINQELGWSIFISGGVAVLVVAVLALIIGLPAVSRTAGLFFAMVTFAFGELIVFIVNRNTSITGGSEGMPVSWGLGSAMPFGWSVYRFFTVILCLVVFVVLIVNAVVRHTHFGLRLAAVRESSELTSGLGYSPTSYRLSIFLIASSLAGLTGVVYAPFVGFINPHLMVVEQSIYFLGLLFVGGTNSVLGAFLGVFLLSTLPQMLEMDPMARPIIVGVAMVVIVLAAPKLGLAGLLRAGARRWLPRWGGPPGSAGAAEVRVGPDTGAARESTDAVEVGGSGT